VTESTAVVILAAGAGTRMRSTLAKPLHPILGRPMIDYVAQAVAGIDADQVIVVLSPQLNQNDAVLTRLQGLFGNRLAIALQREPNGTGSALQAAAPFLAEHKLVLVVFADHPLLDTETVGHLIAIPLTTNAPLTLLTCQVDDPAGYGRIDRDAAGSVRGIVERKDDDPARRTGPAEVNSGMMAINGPWLNSVLGTLSVSPHTNEVYLTELAELAVRDGKAVQTVTGSRLVLEGVNTRAELAHAEDLIQEAVFARHLANGVSLVRARTSVIEPQVSIGMDSVILPGCMLLGATIIGANCTIGPHTILRNATIADGCTITSSAIEDSSVGTGSDVGPFSHIRNGSVIDPNVHIGNFAEIKNSHLHSGVRTGHVSYLGDAEVGARTNIGAGVVTCNFDGTRKHATIIGEDVFVGSDTMLVAPVILGDRSVTGAGAVVTRNVPRDVRVVGVPARPISPEGNRE